MHVVTRPTRRDHDVNFGDRTKLTGGERKTLAWMSLDDSAAFTVYASARLSGPTALVSRIVPMVTIEWGHGGASIAADYPLVRRLRVPLAASTIKLEGRLVDIESGNPAPSDVHAEIAAFIAQGTDGETIPNTRTVVQSGASGILSEEPQQVLSVTGYLATATSNLWLMLFDAVAVPPNGTPPRMAVPAHALATPFALRTISSRAFFAGVTWAASSTPLVLTHALQASLHLEAEFLL